MGILLRNIISGNVKGVPLSRLKISEPRLKKSILRILKENVLFSIATVDSRNRAHINTAYFCFSDDLELYFLSHPESVHCQNLINNPSVAITVFSSAQKWTKPGRGIQIFGECTRAKGSQLTKAKKLYGKRFPAFARWDVSLGQNDVSAEYCLYKVAINKVKVHDEKTFGDGVFVIAGVKRNVGPIGSTRSRSR